MSSKQAKLERFVRPYMENDDLLAAAQPEEKQQYKDAVEELCRLNDPMGFHAKGYGCYGGNAVYECDWPTSRDCMLKALELTGNPYYANTLGYIYYYGRCTNGVPDYDNARLYYSIGYAAGITESMYKLADMYVHGYGVEKDTLKALTLYKQVYDETLGDLEQNGDVFKFADAALRMGNAYAKGYAGYVDDYIALSYYLQAEYGIRVRMESADYYGDRKVAAGIQEAKEKAMEKLGYTENTRQCTIQYPWIFTQLTENCGTGVLRWEPEGTDRVKLDVSAEKKNARFLLIVVPALYCSYVHGFTLTAAGVSPFPKESGSCRFDNVEWDEKTKTYRFQLKGKNVSTWSAEGLVFTRPSTEAAEK